MWIVHPLRHSVQNSRNITDWWNLSGRAALKPFIAHPARQVYWCSVPASMDSFTAVRIIRSVNILQAPVRNAGSGIWIRIKGWAISSATTRVAAMLKGNAHAAEQGGWWSERVAMGLFWGARITAVRAVVTQRNFISFALIAMHTRRFLHVSFHA